VFIEKAKACGSDIIFAVDDWLFANEVIGGLESIPQGDYQRKNIITALAVIRIFNKQGNAVKEDHIKKGIEKVVENTGLMGRWQVIARKPLTICDVGHNYDGLKLTMQQVVRLKYVKLHFIFGSVNDKDLDPVFKLLPANAQYYFCKPDIPRGLDQHELEEKARQSGLSGQAYDSVLAAYEQAMNAAKEEDLIFVSGSTFIVADLLTGINISPR
jgi:dihydrofolate synthase/folylpolyglutamate synthase